MSPGKFELGDYVDVPARLVWFFDHFPEGSLQSKLLIGPEVGQPFITAKAWAYRTPDDPRPGTGLAYEVFPGVTPYTKGSEVMNCETSAWGRALAAIGAPTKGHVASADEVRGAQERRITPVKRKPADKPVEQGGPGPGEESTLPVEDQATLPTLPSDHEHTWVASPTLKKYVVCSDPACRKVVKKEEAEGADAS